MIPDSGPYAQRLIAVISRDTSDGATANVIRPLGSQDVSNLAQKIRDVRNEMSNDLPAYMIPTLIVFVSAMPRSMAGKMDRRAVKRWLEALTQENLDVIEHQENDSAEGQEPVDTEYNFMQEIWAQVLDIPIHRIGMKTPFQSLGGDSIMSMQISAAVSALHISHSLSIASEATNGLKFFFVRKL